MANKRHLQNIYLEAWSTDWQTDQLSSARDSYASKNGVLQTTVTVSNWPLNIIKLSHCPVFCGIVWYSVVLHDIAWYFKLFPSTALSFVSFFLLINPILDPKWISIPPKLTSADQLREAPWEIRSSRAFHKQRGQDLADHLRFSNVLLSLRWPTWQRPTAYQ